MSKSKWLTDIRFWIILSFFVRLVGITNPPLETAHNWRQTTVTMAARNFYEIDNNILYPRIDFAGDKTGITGMEFPVLNYAIYLMSEVFGYQHWYGRLIVLVITCLGLLYFYKVLLIYFNKQTAFYATLLLTFGSIWFAYARKIMPDTFSVSFMIMAIYYASNYLKERTKAFKNIALYSLFLLLAGLSKLPALYALTLLGFLVINKDVPLIRKFLVASVTAAVIVPVAAWYFYWVPHLVETYGFWHFFMGKSLSDGVREILIENLPQTLSRFYRTPMGFSGFMLFMAGAYFAFKNNRKPVLYVAVVGLVSFLVIVFKAGFTFSHHDYYIIPFVPIMAVVAGYALYYINTLKIKKWLSLAILLVVCIENIAVLLPHFRVRSKNKHIAQLDKELDKHSQPSDLIFINSNLYPTPMYFAHRKGWIGSNQEIIQPESYKAMTDKGLKYIVILKTSFGEEVKLDLPVLANNQNYVIYKAVSK